MKGVRNMDVYDKGKQSPNRARIERILEDLLPHDTTGYVRKLKESDFNGVVMPRMTYYGLFDGSGFLKLYDLDKQLLIAYAARRQIVLYHLH